MSSFWKNLPVLAKTSALCSMFVVLLAGIAFQSIIVAKSQSHDGLVINMAGRQRMLTQAMTKAGYAYLYNKEGGRHDAAAKARQESQRAMDWFDMTLSGLISGGKAPLAGDKFTAPLPLCQDKEIVAQLQEVNLEWKGFREHLSTMILPDALPQKRDSATAYVAEHNTILRGKMNKAVKMFEGKASQKLAFGTKVNIAGFVVGLMVTVLTLLAIKRSIIDPLIKCGLFASSVGRGNLDEELELDQKDEAGQLAQSLNSMVRSIQDSMADAQKKVDYLNNIPTPVMVVDKDMTIAFMNPAGADFLDKPLEEVIGSKCFDHFKTPHCNTSECCSKQAMQDVAVYTSETVADPAGMNLPVHYTGAPVKDNQDNVIGAVEYLVDISKQKDVQRGVRSSVDVLSAVVSDVSMFSTEMDDRSTAIAEQAQNVAAAAEEMSISMASVSSSADQSQQNISAVAAATEEMSSTVGEIAQNAEKARAVTLSAVEKVSNASERINALGIAAQEISQVIETIMEVAEQTKLLALNATIEAARAGEAGKGFAVVAEEVRNLAMRSSEAAKNTSSLIEESVKHANNGVDIAGEVSSVLNEIVGSVSKTTDLVSEIAGASQEQAQGIDQVSTAVSQMDKVTQQNAANAEESASASEELNAQANFMQQAVQELMALVSGRSTGKGATGSVAPQSRPPALSLSDHTLHQIAQDEAKMDTSLHGDAVSSQSC